MQKRPRKLYSRCRLSRVLLRKNYTREICIKLWRFQLALQQSLALTTFYQLRFNLIIYQHFKCYSIFTTTPKLLNWLNNQRIIILMEQGKHQRKKSLCRFYLRGLCVYEAKTCDFAHGVWDLNYDYWRQGELIQYDFQKAKDIAQKNVIKSPSIYRNLYEFQTQKIFSIADLAQSRPIRSEIRNLMHQQLYEEFIQLLEFKHPQTLFTQQFLLREFTRAGFNKILTGVMKFSHIVSYLCEAPNSKYFKTTKAIPPKQNKKNVILRKATQQQIVVAYKSQLKKIVKNYQKQLQQTVLKKLLFTAVLPDNVPPLNQVLKQKKLSLADFISKQLGEETSKIIFQTSIEVINQESVLYLKENLPKQLICWNDLYNHLTKVLKNNNGNVINQVKPHLVIQNNWFLFFPMIQFIYNPFLNSHVFKQLKKLPCKCNFQVPFALEQLPLIDYIQLKQGESYDINNFDSLVMCAPHLLNSKVLGVDLQGRLRKGGFVEMIQLNNGKNTFLIDIWDMNERGQFEAFWLARKILRNVMVNPNIIKIFHDCRHDSIGLHEMIETCIVNVFDTSACQTLINQLDCYEKLLQAKKEHKETLNDCKNLITQCNNVKTPGLNQILKKYEAVHGINKNKDKYHKMWSKGDFSFFCKRPIDPDYRDYCIKDVLDLPQVYQKMIKCLPQEAIQMAFWISGLYAQNGYLSIQEDQVQKMEKKQTN